MFGEPDPGRPRTVERLYVVLVEDPSIPVAGEIVAGSITRRGLAPMVTEDPRRVDELRNDIRAWIEGGGPTPGSRFRLVTFERATVEDLGTVPGRHAAQREQQGYL